MYPIIHAVADSAGQGRMYVCVSCPDGGLSKKALKTWVMYGVDGFIFGVQGLWHSAISFSARVLNRFSRNTEQNLHGPTKTTFLFCLQKREFINMLLNMNRT